MEKPFQEGREESLDDALGILKIVTLENRRFLVKKKKKTVYTCNQIPMMKAQNKTFLKRLLFNSSIRIALNK